MKKVPFFSGRDRGVALITVVLTMTLVLALFVMAFTNAMIGDAVTQTYVKGRMSAQCGQAALAVANQILVKSLSKSEAGLTTWPGNILIDKGSGLSADTDKKDGTRRVDSATSTPDVIINPNPQNPNDLCASLVDVDFLFHDEPAGEEITLFRNYHAASGGKACSEGDFYSIIAVSTKMNTVDAKTPPTLQDIQNQIREGVSATASSAFYNCSS